MTSSSHVQAYRPGAFDYKELVIAPREMKDLLRLSRPELLEPILMTRGDFSHHKAARRQRQADICEVTRYDEG